ncbi:MAG: hypothetical protein ACLGHT_00625, partial [Acidimicrobiia bacterium]
MPPLAATVSFRLGWRDGVSVEAAKWQGALQDLGFETVTVAGGGVADVVVPGLDIDASDPPSVATVETALAEADLVIV